MLRARLDRKTCVRVLCGKTLCDGDFGQIQESAGVRGFVFEAGWVQDGETWKPSKYARGQVRGGHRAKFRRAIHVEYEHDPDTGEIVDAHRIHASHWPVFPAKARCPKCDWPNLLDPNELRVTHPMNDPERRSAFEQQVAEWPKQSKS